MKQLAATAALCAALLAPAGPAGAQTGAAGTQAAAQAPADPARAAAPARQEPSILSTDSTDVEPVLDMAWNACPGQPGATRNLDYTGPGTYTLYVTATNLRLPPRAPGSIWYTHRIDLVTEGRAPDAWRFEDESEGNAAGCQARSGGLVQFVSRGLDGCPSLRTGREVPISWALLDVDTRQERIGAVTAYPAGSQPDSSRTYLVARIFLTFRDACQGVRDPVTLRAARFEYAVGRDPNRTRTYESFPEGVAITWNGSPEAAAARAEAEKAAAPSAPKARK